MKNYTFYNKDTGEITGVSLGSIGPDASLLETDTTGVIDGEYSFDKYKIVEGKPVLKTDTELNNEINEEAKIQLLRRRVALLEASDHKVLPDYPTTKLEEWKTYRQALRDLPANTPDPLNVTWPTPPE